MMLTPTNEAFRRENHAEKTLIRKKYCNDLGGHARCKNSITIKKAQDCVRVGERGKEELMVLTHLLLIYRISSVNCFTLQVLSHSVLVPR
jgi:hypothetical protein